jgi:glycosyltransferase involved in cell wall biosynthesis
MSSFIYCCRIIDGNKGVEKKVINTVNAMKPFIKDSKAYISRKNGLKAHFELALKLFTLKEEIVLLRATPFTMILMLPGLLYLKFKNKKIIIDVPTPITNFIEEVKIKKGNKIIEMIKISILYITLPICFYPANRILQYTKESKWFSSGIKGKILEIGNGIDVRNIEFRKEKTPIINNVLNVIAVATLASYHGYDRFINSIYEYKKKNTDYNIIFHIVGEGEERRKLENLTNSLNLDDNIIFYGFKDRDELTYIFNKSHIGLCSLGLHRIKINSASILKAREYAARGIPFILGCNDFDFNNDLDFVYQCKNDDSLINIEEIINWYKQLDRKHISFQFIREFAIKNVDFSAKVEKEIISILNKTK